MFRESAARADRILFFMQFSLKRERVERYISETLRSEEIYIIKRCNSLKEEPYCEGVSFP